MLGFSRWGRDVGTCGLGGSACGVIYNQREIAEITGYTLESHVVNSSKNEEDSGVF